MPARTFFFVKKGIRVSTQRSFFPAGGLSRPSGFVRSVLILAVATAGLSVAGCGSSESEEDHHMEHFVPAHKPASFKGAVDALTERTSHLKLHVGDSGEIVQQELGELADIIGWIPELAADSDLNEQDWTQAVQVSGKMQIVYERSNADGGLETLLADLPPLIESLEPLVPRAGRPEPPMHHDHDHDHDGHHDHHHDHEDDEEHEEHPEDSAPGEPADEDNQQSESDSGSQQ